MNMGEGRKGSPSGLLLGHSRSGSARMHDSPAVSHPGIERDQVLGRLRLGMGHQKQLSACKFGRARDTDGEDAISLAELCQRR